MEVQVTVKEDLKRSDLRNIEICYIYRENHVIVIEEECNEKSIEDQENKDRGRIGLIVIISVVLCMFGMFIPLESKFIPIEGNAREEHLPEWFNIVSLVPAVLIYQICILRFTLDHAVNKSIFAILCILIITTAISVMEISSASKTAAIIVLILWGILFAIILIVNRQEIYNLCACLNNS